jgi:hypothetical protein
MRRRELIAAIGAAALLRSRDSGAQRPGRVYRPGFVVQFPRRFLNEAPGSAAFPRQFWK